MKRGTLLWAAAVISQSLNPPAFAAKATTLVDVVSYDCQQGKLAVAYAKKASGDEYAIVEFEDKTIRMSRLIDRSEPVYASMHGDAGSYRWREIGKIGVLSWLGPEAEANEKVLYEQCRGAPPPVKEDKTKTP
ncbi:hypothetical protein [Sinorhizobium meliloti]|uniref:hypothetical protein n=1 Tax=Rhizobium meliloti TaxID=382 RepID=UPI000FD86993|nr:hypothetical protein [Sinorhizobium meliloti]MDW9620209.1 hypothetical protein [Sinorhizobium meliloti]MQX72439.1 hypothetical protein [Sinorhizobium meliloti]RVG48939.1 hypothetical protein CN226_24080 [Sinorhizobium meliloti]RVL59330.1 hypothetical protein CN141_15500 [Sinorhizobium meliloti]